MPKKGNVTKRCSNKSKRVNKEMTKDNITKLKPYWQRYQEIESSFFKRVRALEELMRSELGDERLEFAYAKFGGGIELYFGIGYENLGPETKEKLIHGHELEEYNDPIVPRQVKEEVWKELEEEVAK